ncbi:MAG: hypothetical protein ACRDTA_13380 [Pseudonocardiaceae bacterium]
MSTGELQWVVSAYVLGFVLLGGRAADLLGRRRMFVLWLVVFVAFSGLGGLATQGWVLILARFATGGRGVHDPRRPVHHHDDLRRGPQTQQGTARLLRDGRGRLLARDGRRWTADRD